MTISTHKRFNLFVERWLSVSTKFAQHRLMSMKLKKEEWEINQTINVFSYQKKNTMNIKCMLKFCSHWKIKKRINLNGMKWMNASCVQQSWLYDVMATLILNEAAKLNKFFSSFFWIFVLSWRNYRCKNYAYKKNNNSDCFVTIQFFVL